MSPLPRKAPAWAIFSLLSGVLGGTGAYWGWQEAEMAQTQLERARHTQARLQEQRAEQTASAKPGNPPREFQELAVTDLQHQDFLTPIRPPEIALRLQDAHHRLVLPALHYDFPAPLDPTPEAGNEPQLHTTRVDILAELNHEQELLTLLDTLNTGPLVLARHCDLERLPERPQPPAPGANIQARCQLEWITGQMTGPGSS